MVSNDKQTGGATLSEIATSITNFDPLVAALMKARKRQEAINLLISYGYKIIPPSKKRGRPTKQKFYTLASIASLGKSKPKGRPRISDDLERKLVQMVAHIKSKSGNPKMTDKAALEIFLRHSARNSGKSETRELAYLPSTQVMLSRARKKLQKIPNKSR